jgi:hypothetical protein
MLTKRTVLEVLEEMMEPVQKAFQALNLISASDAFKEKYEARQKAHRDLLQIVDDNREAEALSMLEITLDAKGIEAEKYLHKIGTYSLEQIRTLYKEIIIAPTPQVLDLLESV